MKRTRYTLYSGLTVQVSKVKRFLAAAGGSLVVTTALAFPAMAAGNSAPGIDRYDANPGRQQATAVGAQCGSGAGSGAFGFLGKGQNEAGGANGQQTGLNNSSVCGNRQSE